MSGMLSYVSESLGINSATLSGAIDIIVVRHPPGSRPQREDGQEWTDAELEGDYFVSTPFHCRFGKLQLLKSAQKHVAIEINGERVDMSMKLGPAGEAFFCIETEEAVEQDLLTSPIQRPSSVPLETNDPPDIDLASLQESSRMSHSDLMPPEEDEHEEIPDDQTNPPLHFPLPLDQSIDEDKQNELSLDTDEPLMWWTWGALPETATDGGMRRRPSYSLFDFADPNLTDIKNSERIQKLIDDDLRHANQLRETHGTQDDRTSSWRISNLFSLWPRTEKNDDESASVKEYITKEEDALLEKEKKRQEWQQTMEQHQKSQTEKLQDDPSPSTNLAHSVSPPINKSAPLTPLPNPSDLPEANILDVNSPPLNGETFFSPPERQSALNLAASTEFSRENIPPFVPSSLMSPPLPPTSPPLLESLSPEPPRSPRTESHDFRSYDKNFQSSEFDTQFHDFREAIPDLEAMTNASIQSDVELGDVKRRDSFGDASFTGNYHTDGEHTDYPTDDDEDHHLDTTSLAKIILPTPTSLGNIKMSLCGDRLGHSMVDNHRIFTKYLVTYEKLCQNPSCVFDPRLIVLHEKRLYPGQVAFPLLISFLAFGKPLSDQSLLNLATQPKFRHMHTRSSRRPQRSQSPQRDREESIQSTPLPLVSSDTDISTNQPTERKRSKSVSSATKGTTETKLKDHTVLDIGDDDENSQLPPSDSESTYAWGFRWWWKSRSRKKHKSSDDAQDTNPDDQKEKDEEETKPPRSRRPHSHSVELGPQELPPPPSGSAPPFTTLDLDAPANGISHVPPNRVSSFGHRHKRIKKALKPTSEMLAALPLREGYNSIKFTVRSSLQGQQSIEASIFLWPHNAKVVVSDVDGTITRSDVYGHLLPWFGNNWTHEDVAELFTNIVKNGFFVLYLTSRGIGQAGVTRQYLFEEVEQRNRRNTTFTLPNMPVIMSPDSLLRSFRREIIDRTPQAFKVPALKDVRGLFAPDFNPFYAAFGNRPTDLISYMRVEIPKQRVFIIDDKGRIQTCNSPMFRSKYGRINEIVNDMFAPRDSAWVNETTDAFNSFRYWSDGVDIDDLSDLSLDENE